MGRGTKRLLGAGIFAGLAYSAWRAWRRRVPESSHDITWDAAPFPFPPIPRPSSTQDVPAPTPTPVPSGPTADPGADGACPLSHPVKAKLSSGIYHLPGGQNYERTKPDRCYVDAAAAEADGLRAAKR
jgi:hypothetical protein